jgi:hypothetical protein
VHTAEAALSWTSISILGVFTLEQAAKLAVFGPPYFVRSAWHSLDAAIIVASLVLEAVLRGVARETVSLLIVFRLWRLVRVMHGVAESVAEEHVVRMERHHDKERALAQVSAPASSCPCGCLQLRTSVERMAAERVLAASCALSRCSAWRS